MASVSVIALRQSIKCFPSPLCRPSKTSQNFPFHREREKQRIFKMTILPFAREKKNRRPLRAPLLAHKQCEDAASIDHGFGEASFAGAVFNLSTTIVGAGIMALPATLRVLGLIPGLVMIVLAGILTESSINMILRSGRAGPSLKSTAGSSYSGIVGEAFGGAGRAILQTCIVVNNLGMLVIYMIIIGDVLAGSSSAGIHHSGVIEEWFGRQWWTTRSCLLLLTTFLVFAPLISLKRVDSLRYTSAVSVALAMVFVVITAGVAIIKLMNGSIGMPQLLPEITDQTSFWKLFTTVPILVTAYICHYSVHPIENELKDPTQMKSIVQSSIVLCLSVYVATSFFGFLLFGDGTMDDILANFDGDLGIPYSSLFNDIVRISYAAHLMLVFPIVFFTLRLNLDGLLFPYAVPIAFDGQRFFSMTVALMGLSFLGANFVPSIWDAFQFTGATASIAIGFIFPAAIALRNVHGIATKTDRVLSWFMIVLAVTSSTVAISSDIYATLSNGGEMGR
ncbi:amino acid transporter AVT6B-like isoform X1 [Magnolia sinica]|uniref:amino acid transporter AVT6B-like isoform X1 n=1 Tax=Magnolia sinica TaxID=86752 RepID=UPI00265B64A0|nr:amino acid transporter AVT6B-like isoform X1 [Magnolia sinica]